MNTALLLILYIIHLFFYQINIILGNLYYSIFYLIGQVIHAVLLHTEEFYKNHPKYKERLLLKHQLILKRISFSSASRILLKSQLRNTGCKKYYTFLQKLFSIMIYLILLPDKDTIKQYFSHKIKTIKQYISSIRKKGLFSIYPEQDKKNIPHNKTDIEIIRLIWHIFDSNPTWGRFKIAFQLFLIGITISPSTVRNYLLKPRPPQQKKHKENSRHDFPDGIASNKIKAKHRNHIWICDFTTVKVLFIHIYIFFIMDIFSRKIIYFDIYPCNPSSEWTIKRFKRAFCESIDTPKVLITDNGNQFIPDTFKQFCTDYSIEHRKGKVKSYRSTAHIERFNRTIKYEALNHIPFLFKRTLRKIIAEFILYYNKFRPHRYHNGKTPDMIYYGLKLLKPPDNISLKIKTKSFCDNLITAFYLEQAA